MNTDPELFSVWWADVKLEVLIYGEYHISTDHFERPVVIIENRAYMVYKVTTRQKEGYKVEDLVSAGLREGSIIRTDVIIPIAPSDLRYKMGDLSMQDKLGLLEYVSSHPPRILGKK